MLFAKCLAAALLTAAACAAGSVAAGEWSCTNEPESGAKTKWTLAIREDGSKLAGKLTDGEVEIALSEVKVDGSGLTFQFFINGKPYRFDGKIAGQEITGRYSGEEARGMLRCEKPKN
jgi:hypothetical protein